MAQNYDDVVAQLLGAGLLIDGLEIGRLRRCRTEGSTERRGWYHLHEMRLDNGSDLIVGSYGIWQGTNNNATKITLQKTVLSAEQRESLAVRLAEDKKRAEIARKADADRAAVKAQATWKRCTPTGDCDYLHKKGVQGHGVRYSHNGAMVVPMLDVTGKIHGLQVIRGKQHSTNSRKRDKEYWPAGVRTKAHFHLLGMPGSILLVAEGYATAASLFEATGLPVAVAFDAGNLAHVAAALRSRYKDAHIMICADDDAFSTGNPGVTSASAAAMQVGGAWVVPIFADEPARRLAFETSQQKLTDFNDLHALEGLHVVRVQIEARLSALNWRAATARAAQSTGGGDAVAAQSPLRTVESTEELLERFSLVFAQKSTVFDHQEHALVAMQDMRDLCTERNVSKGWIESPERKIVRISEVGFDPAGTDPQIKCNLWAGWPTVPKAGSCEALIDLLRYMCGGDKNANELFTFVLRWLAYPIQHPGAKLKTTLVIHGPQGTGKNMFFEAVMAIYGQYGRIIDQSAVEDKFNDYASKKLFLIADEVVARSDLYHIKNKLKAFITGEWIRINPKNMGAYDERNHVNMVFLSNESMPVVLEEDDRRHVVIWTPEKLSPAFYRDVQTEIENGGVAALHDYLLHLDLGDFHPATLPPMTNAKRELIDLSLDSPSKFFHAFESGDIAGFPARNAPKLLTPALSLDMYELYQHWCGAVGLKALNQSRFGNALMRKHKVTSKRHRYDSSNGTKGPSSMMFFQGGHELPDGESELIWLGERIDAFRASLKEVKGRIF